MNIAVIIPTLTGGGAERVAGYLSMWLASDHEVFFFLNDMKKISYEYCGKLIEYSEANDGKECSLEYALPILKKKYKIDVSISFMEQMNFANIRSRNNDVIIISERTNYSQCVPRNRKIDLHIREYYNHADAVVACSHGVKQELINEYGVDTDKIYVIYNFVDKERICESKDQLPEADFAEFTKDSEFFVTVGRLTPVKNHNKLIRQFKVFHDNNPDKIKLAIIGNGELQSELTQLISDLGLKDWVRIFPYMTNPFKYMRGAKAFLFTSELEGLPNVLLEALTLGLPVISSDCNSGPRELLLGETDYKKSLKEIVVGERGMLVQKDIEKNDRFARAMSWVCEHEKECVEMSHAALKYMEQYSNEDINVRWKECIEKAIEKEKKSEIIEFKNTEKEIIENIKHLYIYGAGKVGKRVFNTFSGTYKIDAFVCTATDGLPETVEGVPVISIKEVDTKPDESAFLIGVGEGKYDEVCNTLTNFGYGNYYIPF